MFTRNRQWLAAHPRWTLTLLVLAALGPFLEKPFNIDDPLFVWLAQQVWLHPGNPFGFEVNWYGLVSPMWTVTENPPLAGYYYALAGGLFGWTEISLHLAGLLAALAVILGTHRLALRLCGSPLLAAGAVLFTPVFLVSANTVMSDLPMLALWVWAVVFWVEGLEQNQSAKLLFAGVLIALALLTKYFGVALVPLLAVHGALQKRKFGTWTAALLIPLAALGAYQWFTEAFYGRALFSAAAQFVTAAHQRVGFEPVTRAVIALAFVGGGAASAIFLAPCICRARLLGTVFFLTAIVAGALCFAGVVFKNYGALDSTAVRMQVAAQLIFWAAGGVLLLWLAAADILRHPRDANAWLLALWIAGTFAFAAFGNWTVNGRSVLPLTPAAGILIARSWDRISLKRPQALQIGLAISALFALFVAQSEWALARAVRSSAEKAVAKYGHSGKHLWFEGHWGFQFYMEQLGARAVDYKTFTASPENLLVMPLHNTYINQPPPEIVARREILTVPVAGILTTWNSGVGAGFYSSVAGPLPFGFGKVPDENLFIYDFKSADKK